MLFEAAEVQPWQSKGEQIANAANNLGQSYWFCWRIAQGRIGKRAFPILKAAFARYAERRQRSAHKRLVELEKLVAGLTYNLEVVDRGGANKRSPSTGPPRRRDRPG